MTDRPKELNEKLLIALIVLGSILLYLPFLSRQFIGDDWLWLYNAKKAATDLSIFLKRPMYGYFRPLNMVAIFVMLHIFGPNASIFHLGSIFMHGANVFLLWMVLRAFGAPREIRLAAPLLFGFYYLNCSAIEWISVGHDLWVTGLILIFLILLKRFHERPDFARFSVMFAVGWAAALFKESGLVAAALYFVYLLLRRSNPFAESYWKYSLLYILSYFIFIIAYFQTRTVADKQIELGFGAIINTIYFCSYLLVPLAKGVAIGLSPELTAALHWARIFIMLALPAALLYAIFKGSNAIRVFIFLMLLFIGTVAVFKWNLSLFSPYPEDPASRFMYSPFVGMAVFLAWLIAGGLSYLKKRRGFGITIVGLASIYIAANFAILTKVSSTFKSQQQLSQRIIDGIQANQALFSDIDSVVVITDDMVATEQMISSNKHLPAILLVKFDLDVSVGVRETENDLLSSLGIKNRTLTIGWDSRKNLLIVKENQL